MGIMFEDIEREKQKRMTYEHANDQLGWSPTVSVDEACKTKHQLSLSQEVPSLISWTQGNNFDTTEDTIK